MPFLLTCSQNIQIIEASSFVRANDCQLENFSSTKVRNNLMKRSSIIDMCGVDIDRYVQPKLEKWIANSGLS